MILVVVLSCGACLSWSRIGAKGEQCPHSPNHAHVSSDDKRVQAWYASHHAPTMEVVGHISQEE